jgi:glutamate--cysteine ligase
VGNPVIKNSDWLTELFLSSAQPPSQRKVGVELERFGLYQDGAPMPYSSKKGRLGSAEELIKTLAGQLKSPLIYGGTEHPIGVDWKEGKISLEPGSQLEFSVEPYDDLAAIRKKVAGFEAMVKKITDPWGIHWTGIGVHPTAKAEDISVIPAIRYGFMTDYLPTKGKLATSMMRLTTSIQINLDYSTEEEAIDMLRVAILAAPLSYAIFGNSPFWQGKRSSVLSYRGTIWQNTDPDRSGMIPEIFTPNFGFREYSELLWKLPLMYGQNSSGDYVPTNGESLNTLQRGKMAGVLPDQQNQMNAIREFFPEARLKPGYLEVRSIDGQRIEERYAVIAFWTGLLYSSKAREKVKAMWGTTTEKERSQFYELAVEKGLDFEFKGEKIVKSACSLYKLVEEYWNGRDPQITSWLKPLVRNLEERKNPAQRLVEKFDSPSGLQVENLISYLGEGY